MAGFDEIVAASRASETCILTYSKQDGSIVTHEIFGYSLRNGDLMAWRIDLGKIRRFKIDGILAVEGTGNHFDPEYPMEL